MDERNGWYHNDDGADQAMAANAAISAETTPPCCYLHGDDVAFPCKNDAEWIIIYGWSPDDYTYACNEHVNELTPDSQYVRLIRLMPAGGGDP